MRGVRANIIRTAPAKIFRALHAADALDLHAFGDAQTNRATIKLIREAMKKS